MREVPQRIQLVSIQMTCLLLFLAVKAVFPQLTFQENKNNQTK